MRTIGPPAAMKAAIHAEKAAGRTIGFVPTMGALHEGHLSLVRASKSETDVTVVSIFVNPHQFGPQEDFARYPRDLAKDAALLEGEGVDYIFHPAEAEIYPSGFRTSVEVPGLQDKLCGRSRPGHFRSVCTVVLKLFEIVRPDIAVFGQKDAQQAIILKRLVRDLDLDVWIDVRPIVREPDGLAMSSRNQYLAPEERRAALVLSRSLTEAERAIRGGEHRAPVLIERMALAVQAEPLARLEYAEIVDPDSLDPVAEAGPGALVALAVRIGRTRLIDNFIVPKQG